MPEQESTPDKEPTPGHAGAEIVLHMHVPPKQRATSIAWLIQPAWMVCYTLLNEIYCAQEAGIQRLSPEQRCKVIEAIRQHRDTEAQPVPTPAASLASGNTAAVATSSILPATAAAPLQEGHLVIVTRRKAIDLKIVPKRRTNVKNASIVLVSTLALVTFLREALSVHKMDEVYSIGPVVVPLFKMHWTGLGKGFAPKIEHEDEFRHALGTVLKKRGATVFVEYNLDNLEGFRA
ncbi:hypothetical protein BC835DRAFT_1476297 [Cytidiella melzeri]|nr:hypothetical protein BC835DRAFT_1476297 [Cytidiella melzeri]